MKKTNEEFMHNKSGITLIALIVTIIVLLILAGISINNLTDDNGILWKAIKAKEETENATWNEQKHFIILGAMYENKDILLYLTKEFQKIDSSATVTDMGNGYYIKCNNKKFILDYDFNEYQVNEGDTSFWIWTENDDGTLTITGYKYNPSGKIIIPNFIADKRVKIVSCNFNNNTDLTSMEISYGIEKLYDSLFSGCINLTGDINLPTSLTYLGYGTFSKCAGLTGDVNIKNVEYIGNHVFSHCTGLNGKLIMNANGASVGYMSFYNCSLLKGKAIVSKFIDGSDMSFHACKSLESIQLKDGITLIPQRSFLGCSSLEEVYIPNSVIEIGSSAFMDCSKLKKISIPSTIETIGRYAFSGDKALDCTIELSYETTIGEAAFSRCENLKINYID